MLDILMWPPYLQEEVFEVLQYQSEFAKVINGGYFIEWECGDGLSADTVEAGWHIVGNTDLEH